MLGVIEMLFCFVGSNLFLNWDKHKMKTYQQKLVAGQQKEKELALFLQKNGYTTVSTAVKGAFKAYDLEVYNAAGAMRKIEVKDDIKSAQTNNVAIEMYSINKRGRRVSSGLSATRADYYVYCFPGDKRFYLYHTSTLQEIVAQNEHTVLGGDNNRIRLSLIAKRNLIEVAYKVLNG
jgi:hypothetical protein